MNFFIVYVLISYIVVIVLAEIHDPCKLAAYKWFWDRGNGSDNLFYYGDFNYGAVNIFCGSLNCYDILGIDRTATLKDIKKVSLFALEIDFSLRMSRAPSDELNWIAAGIGLPQIITDGAPRQKQSGECDSGLSENCKSIWGSHWQRVSTLIRLLLGQSEGMWTICPHLSRHVWLWQLRLWMMILSVTFYIGVIRIISKFPGSTIIATFPNPTCGLWLLSHCCWSHGFFIRFSIKSISGLSST